MPELYKRDGHTYLKMGKIKSLNSLTHRWESHILFQNVETKEFQSVNEKFFNRYYEPALGLKNVKKPRTKRAS